MFLARSAFWLSAAFIVMAPAAGVDMKAAARSGGDELAHQSAKALTSALAPENCPLVECAVGRLMVSNTLSVPDKPLPPAPSSDKNDLTSAAFPPPRPDWAY